MNRNNYRTTIVTLTTRLPLALGWLLKDTEWAMGIGRGTHGGKWGEFFHRGVVMTPGTTESLMAAYHTWRGIPLPRSLQPLAQRAQQPRVPPPQPGTYGNVAVARMIARGTQLDSSSSSSQRTASITTPPPRSRATTATRATNVRARAPPAAMSSKSFGPSTSAPRAPVATPHQQRATDATRTTDAPAPSRAGTPQSPRQERASKRAAERNPPQHPPATGIQGHRASPAGSGAVPNPTNTGAVGTRPEQSPGTAHPHREPTPSPTGSQQPQTPPGASAHGHQPAAGQAAATQAQPEPRPRHGAPDRAAAGPAYAPPEDPPTQTHAATPTDTATTRPSDTVRPRTRDPTESLDPQGSGNGQQGGPAGQDTRRTGAPATPRPTNRADGTARRTVISRSPGPRPGPWPGPGAHHRRGGRPAARRPGKPTRVAARVGRPRPRGSATGER